VKQVELQLECFVQTRFSALSVLTLASGRASTPACKNHASANSEGFLGDPWDWGSG